MKNEENNNNNQPSRTRRNGTERKKHNVLYFAVIGVLLVILLLLLVSIFSDPGEPETNELAGVDSSSMMIQEDSSENADTTSSEADTSDSAEQQPEEEEQEEETEEQTEEETEEEAEGDTEEEAETEPAEPSDDLVTEAYTGNWDPIGTSQEGEHTTDFSDGSQDRVEIKQATASATGLNPDDMIEWWVGGDGPDSVVTTVTDSAETEIYRVYLQWVDNGGWQPTKVEELRENDKK